MIMNKGAYERGFGHGCVYKSYYKELNDQSAGNSSSKSRYKMFNNKKTSEFRGCEDVELKDHGLQSDGMPNIGKKMT